MKKKFIFIMLIPIAAGIRAQNVGIGTSTPVSKLEVKNGAITITDTQSSATLTINRANTVEGSSNQISFQDNSVTAWALGGTNIGSAGAGNLSLYNYLLNANALTVSGSNNNVGIGTVSPGTRLEVAGGYDGDGITITGSTFGPKDIGLQLVDDGGHAAFLGLASGANAWMSGVFAGDIILGNRSGSVWIGNGSASAFPLMQVSSNGRVNIGNLNTGTNGSLSVFGTGITTGQFYNSGGTHFNYGLEGDCATVPDGGIGVAGFGGWIGVRGSASSNGTGDRYGAEGVAQGGTGINYGVYGLAAGTVIEGATEVAYGVYGYAYSAATVYAGYFDGDVFATGLYQTSDRKFKNDIRPLTSALSIIGQLKPSVYTFKTNEFKQMSFREGLQYGLIADEVNQVLPGLVKKAVQPATYKEQDKAKTAKITEQVEFSAVNYTGLIPILIGAVKEQQVIISNLKKEVDELAGSLMAMNKKKFAAVVTGNEVFLRITGKNSFLIHNKLAAKQQLAFYEQIQCPGSP